MNRFWKILAAVCAVLTISDVILSPDNASVLDFVLVITLLLTPLIDRYLKTRK